MAQPRTFKDVSVGRSDMFKLPPDIIQVKDGWNAREADDPANQEHIETLARSIAEIGQKEPITVFWENDTVFVSDGHCRLAAIHKAIENGAEIKTIMAKSEDKHANDSDRVLSLMVRNSGKPLSPLEQSGVVHRLIAFGWSEKDIADKTGLSVVRVRQLLELRATPTEVQNMVAKGEVSATMAVTTVKEEGAEAAVETLTDAVKTAKKEGKKRAMPKHKKASKASEASETNEGMAVPKTDPYPKPAPENDVSDMPMLEPVLDEAFDAVKAIIEDASVIQEGDNILLEMPESTWNKLAELLEIDSGLPPSDLPVGPAEAEPDEVARKRAAMNVDMDDMPPLPDALKREKAGAS